MPLTLDCVAAHMDRFLSTWCDAGHDEFLQFDAGLNDFNFYVGTQGNEKAQDFAIILL